ncbi:HdeD family acid-resistance protein [Aquicoccus sp. G2-2]|uniref:HdeD family acid-resistance protein n=1 Tax=Aquicoccus sp. G2-2 TaxID=3092120 RepID=UPI002AE006EE|nr:DUF308 domain-containing protein [Aquicoccus sp. G2-2]MEA1114026.1 DUF308 domain-containing protein [Aquicoccus sp. G2-2]
MKISVILIVIGVLLALGGIFAFANPLAASIAVTTLVGFAFLVTGAIQAWAAFDGRAPGGRFWHGVSALMGIVAGVWLLANPLQGMVSLTLLLGVVFLVTGVLRIGLGFRIGQTQAKTLLILSGIAGVVVAVLIFSDFEQAATSFLGILLGVELLAQAFALITLGFWGRKSGF